MYSKQILLVGVAAIVVGCSGGDPEVSDFATDNSPGTATISGIGLVGETLTAVLNDPDGVQSNTVSYLWYGDNVAIAGADSSTYTLTANEGRKAVTVKIRYTDDKDVTSTAVSNAITATPLNVAPTLAIDVPGAGAIVGQALTAVLVDGNGFGAVNYQWIGSVTGPIAGATDVSFRLTPNEVGENISVSATYTDDDGYDEDLTSAEVGPVTAPPPEGNIELLGLIEVGATLTATVFDGDGFGAVPTINYVWTDENGVELQNEVTDQTENDYVLQPAQLGLTVTVTATYIDGAANPESPSETTRDFIHSFIVDGETSLAEAVNVLAVDGDIIGLDSALGADDYEDMAELEITTDNLTIRLVAGSTAIITGSTCIVYGSSSTGVTIDGLIFDDLTLPDPETGSGNCDEGEGSIKLQGSFNTFSNNQILGQADTRPSFIGGSDEVHYMTVGGTDNVVERNLFEGLSTSEAEEGAAISMYISRTDGDPINQSNGSNERNIIQYNLFRNFLPDVVESDDPAEWDTDSNGFGVQIGRSSSRDGGGLGAHVVQYNRFDTVLTDRRVILVQGGGNTIHGNTIVNSWGNVALEHGYGNTVSSNIIISNGVGYTEDPGPGGIAVSDNLDGGISFVPLGHTIVDNFVGNIASNSSDRAGLHIDSETLEPSDSSSFDILGSGLDLTNVVARNTFINIRNAIQFEHDANENGIENCTNLDYLLDFDDNLVANQSAAQSIFGTSAGEGRTAILLDQYTVDHGCRLDDASEFTNTHIYSLAISDTDLLFRAGGSALVTGVNGNIFIDASEDGATLTAPNADGLVEGTGPDAGIGADVDSLTFITEDMVGPGSTWTPVP